MSSREEILANIRKNTQKRFDYPEWEIKATTYPDIIEKFCEVSRVVGGEAVLLGKGEDINAVIRRTYPDAGRIASNLDEITCATFNPDELDRAQDLDGTEIAVVDGEIGVAENGAVWIPKTVKYKALYFIAEKLVIILDRNRIVSNMHEA
ncbi:LutC/YkgG family protein, partial [Bacteroides salyersiae]